MIAVGPARAAEPTEAPKVAVLDVKAVGNLDPASVVALSSLIASEAARSRVKVISGADLQALVGLEVQKQLAGCSDGSCLAQVGGALGVDYLLASEIGEVGGRWLLTTTLLDVARSTALARVTKVAKTPGELVDVAGAAVAETLAALSPAQLPAATPAAAAPAPAAETPVAALSTNLRAPMRIAGFSLVGVGGGALIAGVVAGVLAKNEHADAKATPPATDATLSAKKASIDKKLWIADGLFIAATLAGAAGAALVLTAPAADAPLSSATVGFAPTSGGGVLVVSGGF
jgi:hypothetical protein